MTTVHTDAAEPYYTVTLSNGSTRTTEAAHVLVPQYNHQRPHLRRPRTPSPSSRAVVSQTNSNGKTAPFQPNDRVLYKPPKGSTLPPEKATVLKVHWDAGDPPYYSIQLDSTGAERQTDAQRLEKFVPDYNAGARRRRRPWIGPKCNSRPWVLVNRASRRRSRVMPSSSRSLYSSNRAPQQGYAPQQQGFPPQQGYPQQQQFGGGAPFGQPQQGFQQQFGLRTATTGLPTAAIPATTAGVSTTAAAGFPPAARRSLCSNNPQGGFPGGFPGRAGSEPSVVRRLKIC